MTEYETIRTSTWEFALPKDWQKKGERDDGALYFATPDESKAVFVSVLKLEQSEHRDDPDGTFQSFWDFESESLKEMQDCRWVFSEDRTTRIGTTRTAMVSVYDQQRKYLIVTKLIVRLPFVIRSSFHDYDCAKPDVSIKMSAPILQSLKLLR